MKLPKIIPENYDMICTNCGKHLGAHLDYDCPLDRGTFSLEGNPQPFSRRHGSAAQAYLEAHFGTAWKTPDADALAVLLRQAEEGKISE